MTMTTEQIVTLKKEWQKLGSKVRKNKIAWCTVTMNDRQIANRTATMALGFTTVETMERVIASNEFKAFVEKNDIRWEREVKVSHGYANDEYKAFSIRIFY